MQNNKDEQKKKWLEESNFLIAILIGLMVGLLIESLFKIFDTAPKQVFVIIAIVSVVAIFFLFSKFRKNNSIHDYTEYEVIFNKKIKKYKWKEFYRNLINSIKDELKEKKIRISVYAFGNIITKIFKLYDNRIVISKWIGAPQSYIDVIEKFGNKSRMIIKFSEKWYGYEIKKIIDSAIKHEKEMGHIEIIKFKETDYLFKPKGFSYKFIREKLGWKGGEDLDI